MSKSIKINFTKASSLTCKKCGSREFICKEEGPVTCVNCGAIEDEIKATFRWEEI